VARNLQRPEVAGQHFLCDYVAAGGGWEVPVDAPRQQRYRENRSKRRRQSPGEAARGALRRVRGAQRGAQPLSEPRWRIEARHIAPDGRAQRLLAPVLLGAALALTEVPLDVHAADEI